MTVMTIESWLESALQDAERRQLPALRSILETLARATAILRAADWNLEATDRHRRPAEHVD
jgi:hypothetical protein